MRGSLEDLDELVLRCRNKKARAHIQEAVAGYRAGAYRSSIVATWIAVCYDLIEKLRELTLAGDKQAEAELAKVEEIHRTGDMQRALAFERELLIFAKDRLELISPLEFMDLKRLQDDRNRCAHPSLSSESEEYAPPAELARLHIHSAVTHLLMYEPAQGKYALELLHNQIRSDYFPMREGDALKVLSSGPLRRARASLVRNLAVVLMKDLVIGSVEHQYHFRIKIAMKAIRSLHPATFKEILNDKLSIVVSQVADDKLHNIFSRLVKIDDVWSFLDETQRIRLKSYVLKLPKLHLDELEHIETIKGLDAEYRMRVKRMVYSDFSGTFFFDMPNLVFDKCIDLYLGSRTFSEANSLGQDIHMASGKLDQKNITKIIAGMSANSQVMGSNELPNVIKAMRDTRHFDDQEFDELLKAHDLAAYVTHDDEIPF